MPNPVFCEECGFKYQSAPKFCGNCGVSFDKSLASRRPTINKDEPLDIDEPAPSTISISKEEFLKGVHIELPQKRTLTLKDVISSGPPSNDSSLPRRAADKTLGKGKKALESLMRECSSSRVAPSEVEE